MAIFFFSAMYEKIYEVNNVFFIYLFPNYQSKNPVMHKISVSIMYRIKVNLDNVNNLNGGRQIQIAVMLIKSWAKMLFYIYIDYH